MTEQHFSWQEKVDDVRSKGILGMQLYVILTTPTNGMGPVLENMGPHLAYQKKLQDEGITFGAGPFADDAEEFWQGDGMVIVRAASLAEAGKFAAEDPMHSSGARTFRIRPWLLNEGGLTVKVRYSDGGRDIL